MTAKSNNRNWRGTDGTGEEVKLKLNQKIPHQRE
jgi:hypothetical protein